MSTTIYTLRSGPDWTGVATRTDGTDGATGTVMTPTNGTALTWAAPPLRPGRPHQLTITITAAGTSSVPVIVQGRTTLVDAGIPTTITTDLDTTRPVTVTITATTGADVTLTLTTPDTIPDHPRPCDVLALDAWIPIPTDALRWGQGRWDLAAWDQERAVPGTLVWDRGVWDGAFWDDVELTHSWASIIGPGTSLEWTRGVAATGPVLAAEAGTLTLDATSDLQPRALGMRWGTPIRLYHWPTGTILWTGWVTDAQTTPAKTGKGTARIVAADAVSALASTTRYGAMPDGGGTETWTARLTRLMASAPAGLTATSHGTTNVTIAANVWETTLAEHLDALVASSGGAWAITRDGALDVWATLPTDTPTITLTDTHDDDAATDTVIHYTAGPSTWSMATVIASLEATTHGAAKNSSNEWQSADTTITVTDPTSALAWGGQRLTVDLLTPPGQDTTDAATRLLRRATDAPILQEAEWWPATGRATDTATGPRMLTAATIDPLTPVATTAAGEHATALIARITHTTTPTTWRTSVTLTPGAS